MKKLSGVLVLVPLIVVAGLSLGLHWLLERVCDVLDDVIEAVASWAGITAGTEPIR